MPMSAGKKTGSENALTLAAALDELANTTNLNVSSPETFMGCTQKSPKTGTKACLSGVSTGSGLKVQVVRGENLPPCLKY